METTRTEDIQRENFEREVLSRLTRIETRLEEQDFKKLTEKVDTALSKSENNEKRIQKLEESNSWIIKTILASIITAILAVILKFK